MQLPPPTSGSVVLDGVELDGPVGGGDAAPTAGPADHPAGLDLVAESAPQGVPPRGAGLADLEVRTRRPRSGPRSTRCSNRSASTPTRSATGARIEFSGGQCQRICIARSLIVDPKVLICDEPVSALDVSVQAQILNLLEAMKQRYGLTLVFISHDLGVVKNVSDRVAVMYLGKLCEVGRDRGGVRPRRPPLHEPPDRLDPGPEPHGRQVSERRTARAVELPSPITPPSGCRFRTRCPAATERCARRGADPDADR